MSRHSWETTANGRKCKKCKTKVVYKKRPSKKVKGQKVAVEFHQEKGGSLVEGAPGPCAA